MTAKANEKVFSMFIETCLVQCVSAIIGLNTWALTRLYYNIIQEEMFLKIIYVTYGITEEEVIPLVVYIKRN